MEELKSIKELAKEIKDDRLLVLFSAFAKAAELKDYKIMKKLIILRGLIAKCEKWHFEYALTIAYKHVFNELQKRDYFYWERKLLLENLK